MMPDNWQSLRIRIHSGHPSIQQQSLNEIRLSASAGIEEFIFSELTSTAETTTRIHVQLADMLIERASIGIATQLLSRFEALQPMVAVRIICGILCGPKACIFNSDPLETVCSRGGLNIESVVAYSIYSTLDRELGSIAVFQPFLSFHLRNYPASKMLGLIIRIIEGKSDWNTRSKPVCEEMLLLYLESHDSSIYECQQVAVIDFLMKNHTLINDKTRTGHLVLSRIQEVWFGNQQIDRASVSIIRYLIESGQVHHSLAAAAIMLFAAILMDSPDLEATSIIIQQSGTIINTFNAKNKRLSAILSKLLVLPIVGISLVFPSALFSELLDEYISRSCENSDFDVIVSINLT